MRTTLKPPFQSASGQVFGRKSRFYARTNRKTGVVTIACKGNPWRNPPTPAQLAQWQRFTDSVRERWRIYRETHPKEL